MKNKSKPDNYIIMGHKTSQMVLCIPEPHDNPAAHSMLHRDNASVTNMNINNRLLSLSIEVYDGLVALVVSALDGQTRGWGFDISFTGLLSNPDNNEYTDHTLSVRIWDNDGEDHHLLLWANDRQIEVTNTSYIFNTIKTTFRDCFSSSLRHVCGGPVVSVLNCHSRGPGFKFRPGQKFGSRFLLHLCPLANSSMMSTLTVHCQWEDETVRQRTGHPLSYTKAKKIKLLTPHTHRCPRASLRNCSSFSSFSV